MIETAINFLFLFFAASGILAWLLVGLLLAYYIVCMPPK
jgi:hypothetical protein